MSHTHHWQLQAEKGKHCNVTIPWDRHTLFQGSGENSTQCCCFLWWLFVLRNAWFNFNSTEISEAAGWPVVNSAALCL